MIPPRTSERVWELLRTIPDPEIPVISLVDLRVVTSVQLDGCAVSVTLRPTFSGCPALHHMREEVERVLKADGFSPVRVTVDHTVSWSTNDLDASTKDRLRSMGIAPPPMRTHDLARDLGAPVVCPLCGSRETRLDSTFGSTLCKQIFFCHSCRQSFDRFKPL